MSIEFNAPPGDLKGRVRSGVAITGIAQAVKLLVQIGSVVVLSRLLLPAEFGLFAMAGPVLAFVMLFQDLGLGQAVIQRATITRDEVSSLFWINLGMSLGLAAMLALIAPLVGQFYHDPHVAKLTAAMSLMIIVAGVGSLHTALLNRQMRFGALALIDGIAAVASLTGCVIAAQFSPTFWALYVGALIGIATPALAAWMAVRWRPSLPTRHLGARQLMHFGAGITGFNLTNFFARNLDNVLIGRVWGSGPLGLYDRAYKLLLMPIQQINAPLARVMLPTLARLVDDPERYRRAYLRTLAQILLIAVPGIAFMAASADRLVPFLLGPKWVEAAPIFAVLGIAGLVQSLNNPSGWLLISQARTWDYMRWGMFSAATAVISFFIGLPFGALGVAIAYATGEYLRTPLLWWYVTRRGPIRWRDIVTVAGPHFLGALASLIAVHELGAFALPPLISLIGCLVGSYAASTLVVASFSQGRRTLAEAADLLGSSVRPLMRRRQA